MREKDARLSQQCLDFGQAAIEAEKWLQDNKDIVGSEATMLSKNMFSINRTFMRLSRAASRKMCIAVFGPSQAGKSYLISALARDKNDQLIAEFAGEAVDFVTRINPEGGKESTGLVTRFTTTPPPGVTKDCPVRLRLFSEKDLVRVFANTYYNDSQHEDSPSQQELLDILRELSQKKCAEPVSPLTRDDMEDIREYMQQFKSDVRVQLLNNVYWKQAADLAPYLRCEDRTRLFGLIWNSVPEFNGFFRTLIQALEALGNAPEVSCPLDALLPREKSIIDVALLIPPKTGEVSMESEEELLLRADDGKSIRLKRRHVTALTAELTIYMPEKPAPFFEYTDLLDFPGYRSRLKTSNLEGTLKNPGELETFFLRGKVAYLFERYCEEREITGMMLCIGPSNQEVQDLPNAVDNWIRLTQGSTPEERRNHDAMLYLVLTKMDMEFEDKKGAKDAGNRWENRMQSSLVGFFGRAHSWPSNWDGQPFKNVFILRNPNVVCDAFDRDDNGKETGIAPRKQAIVDSVKNSFFTSESVKKHFTDPAKSWEAAMALNDGGISLLIEKLAPICDPDRKYNQTRDRALEQIQSLVRTLERFHRSDDYGKRVEIKTKLAKELIGTLAQLVGRQCFADFLYRFAVSDHDLYDMAMACDDELNAQAAEASATPITGIATSADDVLGELFGDAAAPAAAPAAEGSAGSEQGQTAHGMDQIEIFCRSAVDAWVEKVREITRDANIQRVYQLSTNFLESFANELIVAISRMHVLEDMIQSIRTKSAFCNITREVMAWRMASEVAYRINSFVCWLGHDARLGQGTEIIFNNQPATLFAPTELTFGPYGEPVVPALQQQFDRPYYMDWLKAFFDCIVGNAVSGDENFDPVQNNILGEILAKLNLDQ